MIDKNIRKLVLDYFFDNHGRMPNSYEEEEDFVNKLMPAITLLDTLDAHYEAHKSTNS